MNKNHILSICSTITVIVLAINCGISGAETMTPKSSGTPAQRIAGKALASSLRCTGCHGSNLSGFANFAPSLKSSGVLKEYNQKTFERVLNTGITNDGTPVTPPMKVYGLKASEADDIYFYLKSLK